MFISQVGRREDDEEMDRITDIIVSSSGDDGSAILC
jgi:hypothetical protein